MVYQIIESRGLSFSLYIAQKDPLNNNNIVTFFVTVLSKLLLHTFYARHGSSSLYYTVDN